MIKKFFIVTLLINIFTLVNGQTIFQISNLVYPNEKIADLECFLNVNGRDGKHCKTGNYLPMSAYIYEVYFQDFKNVNIKIGVVFLSYVKLIYFKQNLFI